MEELKIVHRDLKLDNILLKEEYVSGYCNSIKIADFGLASILESGKTLKESCGTPGLQLLNI